MPKYRKKPVVIDAVQLRWTQWSEVCALLGDALSVENPEGARTIPASEASDTCGEAGPDYIALDVRTAHGEIAVVRHGDWIIPEKQPGRFYPCKPDVFADTYEPVEDPDKPLTCPRCLLRYGVGSDSWHAMKRGAPTCISCATRGLPPDGEPRPCQ